MVVLVTGYDLTKEMWRDSLAVQGPRETREGGFVLFPSHV